MKNQCPKPIVLGLAIAIYFITIACSNSSKKKVEEVMPVEEVPAETAVLPNNKQEVINYLTHKGFLIKTSSGQIIREGLPEASPQLLSRSIRLLKTDSEEHQTTIFLLRVSGAALPKETDAHTFIDSEILSKDDSFEVIQRMVGFLQRQDRPVIKTALLNTVRFMSDQQCVDYLKYIGYAHDGKSHPNAVKNLPVFYQIALLDRLRKNSGEAQEVFLLMKKDLNVQG